MKFKYKAWLSICIGASILMSCEDFTNLQPKGKNLLNRVEDMDLLLNQNYTLNITNIQAVSGDAIYSQTDVPTLLSSPTQSINKIILTCDEKGHDTYMAEHAPEGIYGTCYSFIGARSNPILLNIATAHGDDEALRQKIKCEALLLRAHSHYLLAQIYCKPYNPATADTDQGIIYMTEDKDIKKSNPPSSLKESYELMLADVDNAINIGGLPDENINKLRFNKPSAYASKALILMAMQRYDEAAEAARSALAINGEVADYRNMITKVQGYILGGVYDAIKRGPLDCVEDYFTVYDGIFSYETPFANAMYEEGHICKSAIATQDMMYDYIMSPADEIGLTGYRAFGDMESSWNSFGFKSTQMYLILAEVAINSGDYDEAMRQLDVIRIKRIDPSIYSPLAGKVNDKASAIKHLKQTAHGENAFTIYNFIDRKRWTILDDYKETFTREIAGNNYTLKPESSLWIFPYPKVVIAKNPYLKNNF